MFRDDTTLPRAHTLATLVSYRRATSGHSPVVACSPSYTKGTHIFPPATRCVATTTRDILSHLKRRVETSRGDQVTGRTRGSAGARRGGTHRVLPSPQHHVFTSFNGGMCYTDRAYTRGRDVPQQHPDPGTRWVRGEDVITISEGSAERDGRSGGKSQRFRPVFGFRILKKRKNNNNINNNNTIFHRPAARIPRHTWSISVTCPSTPSQASTSLRQRRYCFYYIKPPCPNIIFRLYVTRRTRLRPQHQRTVRFLLYFSLPVY